MPNRRLNVFLCHAKEDKPTVRELYRQLSAEGWLDVWLDEENLFPGQEWDMEIEKAVEQADVVLVCLSTHSVDKEGYVQKELRFVLNIADEKPEGTIFVVPLRLDDCQVPRRIRAWQYVDYFPKSHRKLAYQRLLESLKLRAGKLGISMEKPAPHVGQIANFSPAAGVGLSMPVEDEIAKAERERKAREERDRLAAQKAENERIVREKAEAERAAKAEHDRLARQKTEERRKATAEAFRRINLKRIFAVGVIALALVVLFFVGNFIVENLPSVPTPTKTSEVSETSEVSTAFPTFTATPSKTITPTLRLPTETSTITFTSTPEFSVGSTLVSPKDGMTMLYIPAGEFSMGSESGNDDEKPVHTVYLDSYWMDQTEVTNAKYAKCVEAGKCDPPSSSNSYTRDSYYGNSEFNDYPVIYVSWNDAKAYCEWRGDGTRLPTEAEWEKAASWDDDKKEKRVHPWGDSIDCTFANYQGNNEACVGDTTKVGSYSSGASFYGLLDMAGNIWEWVADWYSETFYASSPASNPLGPASGQYRVLRGGTWGYYVGDVRSASRSGDYPTDVDDYVGFRCARSP